MFQLLGTPSDSTWPGYKDLPRVQKMKFVDYPIDHLRQKVKKNQMPAVVYQKSGNEISVVIHALIFSTCDLV